jgi:4a-hydroxytetrahydrobiopterin dehydratase
MTDAVPGLPLTPGEISAALAGLPGWSGDTHGLRRTLRFAGFAEALAFMTGVAPAIDRLGHHPDWRNVYERIEIALATHDAGDRVTALDLELARLIDRHLARRQGR